MSTGSPDLPNTVLHVVDGLGLSGKTRNLVSLATQVDRRRFAPVVCTLGTESSPLRGHLDAAGVIHSVEKFFGDLLQTKDFTFLDGEILRGALLVAAVLVVLQIVITVIAAAFYNVFAELFGGVEITISEDESAL